VFNNHQDFVPKLKEHILPRIKMQLNRQSNSRSEAYGCEPNTSDCPADVNCVFFKSDRMYRHHLLRINYTAYDVRRSQDLVNPGTSHRDIIMLSNNDTDDEDSHPFCYARVLGIYHVNVIYTGTGMLDYTPRRLDFLWVRWYQYSNERSIRWNDYKLDALHFLPVSSEHAFGFVDPQDVLRTCHIFPAFKYGKRHFDGISISRCAKDGADWRQYLANRCVHPCCDASCHQPAFRFVDRDMMMRYHWGLAIGHIYTHKPFRTGQVDAAVHECEGTVEDSREEYQEVSCVTFGGSDHEDMEHSLVTRDNDDLDGTDASESDRDDGHSDGEVDDDMFAVI
jgi:hypothetical protein